MSSEAMAGDPNYQMPVEDQLRQAEERATAYSEMSEIARNQAAAAKAEAFRLRGALLFYARHEHWMSQTENGSRRLLVAMKGDHGPDGWTVAEAALRVSE